MPNDKHPRRPTRSPHSANVPVRIVRAAPAPGAPRRPEHRPDAKLRPHASPPSLPAQERARRTTLLWIGVGVTMIVIIGAWLSVVRFSFSNSLDRGGSLFQSIRNRLSSVLPLKGEDQETTTPTAAEVQDLEDRVFPTLPNANR